VATEPDDLQETMSFRHNVTGIRHVIFLSPHGVKVAIDPDNLNPRDLTTVITIDGGIIGDINPQLGIRGRIGERKCGAILDRFVNCC
jgi:hypothetical protein